MIRFDLSHLHLAVNVILKSQNRNSLIEWKDIVVTQRSNIGVMFEVVAQTEDRPDSETIGKSIADLFLKIVKFSKGKRF